MNADVMLPAVGQGALGIETRAGDASTQALVAALDDAESRACVTAERALLHELQGGCQVPLGAWARLIAGELHIEAGVFSADGTEFVRREYGPGSDPAGAGERLGQILIEAGADRILRLAGRRLDKHDRRSRKAAGRQAHRRHARARTGRRTHPHARAHGRRDRRAPRGRFGVSGRFPAARPCACELGSFDWVLFTSQNAVRFVALRLNSSAFRRQFAKSRSSARRPRKRPSCKDFTWITWPRITRRILWRRNCGTLAGRRVFLPRSDRAGDHLAVALREGGAQVTDVVAYRTVAPEAPDQAALDRIRAAEIDVTIFASPSAFHNLDGFLGAGELAKLAEHVQFAAIGPTTAKAMRESGVRVHIEAEEASAAGLADAIAKYYHEQPGHARQP